MNFLRSPLQGLRDQVNSDVHIRCTPGPECIAQTECLAKSTCLGYFNSFLCVIPCTLEQPLNIRLVSAVHLQLKKLQMCGGSHNISRHLQMCFWVTDMLSHTMGNSSIRSTCIPLLPFKWSLTWCMLWHNAKGWGQWVRTFYWTNDTQHRMIRSTTEMLSTRNKDGFAGEGSWSPDKVELDWYLVVWMVKHIVRDPDWDTIHILCHWIYIILKIIVKRIDWCHLHQDRQYWKLICTSVLFLQHILHLRSYNFADSEIVFSNRHALWLWDIDKCHWIDRKVLLQKPELIQFKVLSISRTALTHRVR